MRRRVLGAAAALAVTASFAVGIASATAGPQAPVVCRFSDPELIESSGLVARGSLLWTVNDSGDTGRVFGVDAATCETVGVTTWSQSPTDVEAIAPAADRGAVWVGDIGDNGADRAEVAVAQVPVGRGDRSVTPTTYRLTYPGGPQDAETLMRDPVSGRLVIVTKTFFGGDVMLAPATLSPTGVNRMTKVGEVLATATDGAFFPDGRHVVVRDYARAAVYSWPDLDVVDLFDLPEQQQGEGLAVTDYRSILLSSEGQRSPVLRMPLPAVVVRAVTPVETSPPSSPGPTSPEPTSGGAGRAGGVGHGGTGAESPADRPAWPWLTGGVVGLAMLVVLARSLRPRG